MANPTTTARLVANAARAHSRATKPTVAECHEGLVADFAAENRRRSAAGRPELLCPSPGTLVRAVRGSHASDARTAPVGAAEAPPRLLPTEPRP